jgi:tetratricopeptide (TPR) repeat protein
MNEDLSETQPSSPAPPHPRKPMPGWAWLLITIALLGGAILLGALAGNLSASRTLQSQQAALSGQELRQQYDLGVKDLEAGRYEVAKQRFEYIINTDPYYPGAMEMLAQSMQVLYATASPTAPPATITPTATRDPRPIEELYNQALTQVASQDWDGAIDTLGALRKEDRTYQTARVDGMLYLALRSRGVAKILQGRNLEGGIYDLAQAGRFGPLDVEANQARQWARLYIIGLSFWEVHPEQAVYYFSQVAAAVPNLSDGSGWTAAERYRAALIQYGDLLASQDAWCEAMQQYELALAIRPDAALQEAQQMAAERCLGQTPTATIDATLTLTVTETAPSLTATVTPTLPYLPSATPTATLPEATQTSPPEISTPTPTSPGVQPTPTHTQASPPMATSTPEAQGTPYPSAIQSAAPAGSATQTIQTSDLGALFNDQRQVVSLSGWWNNLISRLVHW